MKATPTLILSMLGLTLLSLPALKATHQENFRNATATTASPFNQTARPGVTSPDLSTNTSDYSDDKGSTLPFGSDRNGLFSNDTANTTDTAKPATPTATPPGGTSKQPTPAPASTATPRPAASPGLGAAATALLVLGMLVLLALLLLAAYLWTTRRSSADSRARRLLRGLRERVHAAASALEGRLGLRLWPPRKRVDDEEEEQMSERGGGERREGGGAAGRGGEEEEEGGGGGGDGDSSDDYSSLEGVDLRERAKQREEGEERRRSGGEGGSEAAPGGGEDALASAALEKEQQEGAEGGDLTAL